MSKQGILDIISLNVKLYEGLNNGSIKYDNYMSEVKPLIESFEQTHKTTPNLFIQDYLKSLSDIDKPYSLANYGYRGRNSIKDFSWACYHFKYEFVTQHYASYSPQLYILIHSKGIKFGLDYGSEVHNDDSLVTTVLNRPDIITEIINCNREITAFTLTEGASYLATENDLVEFKNDEDVKGKWNNKIHFIKQFRTDEIPDNIDEIINQSLISLLPLFKKLCAIKTNAYTDTPTSNLVTAKPITMVNEPIDEAEDYFEEYKLDNFISEVFVEIKEANVYKELLLKKKNIILQGPPGTGKTFVAKRIAYLILGQKRKNNIRTIQFHQSYSYEDFIQGYRPDDNGGFLRKEGVFYNFVKEAKKHPDEKFFFIIDEINRGNLSKIFGELLMLIEADKRGDSYSINLIYEPEKEFSIPENIYLIGTMNTADRSLAIVDYALRRRFAFIDVNPNFGIRLKSYLALKGVSDYLINHISISLDKLNQSIISDDNLGKGFCIGHSYFCTTPDAVKLERQWFNNIINYEIGPILKEYWFDDLGKAESLISAVLL
jgi:hypothetical protein